MKITHWIKALSDDTRLRLLNLLVFHEFNVKDLLSLLKMGQSRVSRHLKILLDAGLVSARRDGLWVFYRSVRTGVEGNFIQSLLPYLQKEVALMEDLKNAHDFLESKKEESRRHFDRLSKNWEDARRDLFGSSDFIRILQNYPKANIAVDLGCGTGSLIHPLLQYSTQVIGVDHSEGMITKAKRKFQNHETVSFRLGQLEHLPLADSEVDRVIMNMVLHHIEDPIRVFQEVRRILKPSGIFLLIDLYKHTEERLRKRYGDRWLGFEKAELLEWIQDSHFSLLEEQNLSLPSGLTAFKWIITI